MERLRCRDAQKYIELLDINQRVINPQPHPLFSSVCGDVEPWEKSYQKKPKLTA